MDRKLVGTLLLLLASGGCRACSSSCDYLPPVMDGPYAATGERAGSAFAGGAGKEPIVEEFEDESFDEAVDVPTPVALPQAVGPF